LRYGSQRADPDDPPSFYLVPFGMADPDRLMALAHAAGFGEASVDVVRKEAEFASAHTAAQGLVYGNPIVTAIRERGGVDADAVVEAVAMAVASRCGGAPTRARMKAFVVTARPS
jgi:hypothetical protein